MHSRTVAALLAAVGLTALAAPGQAGAASVAYIDGHNVVLASPDGAVKHPLTADGTAEAAWRTPAQGHDGRTVAVRTESFDEGRSRRPVLHLFGPDGARAAANVMPVYAGATVPVYPIGLDIDWGGRTVAYGYQYCGWACKSIFRGYWLTFSDQQGAFPTNPQGQSDAFFPTFYGRRVVSSDSGGAIFVQPDVPEAPFTNAYQGWLRSDQVRLSRAELAPAGDLVALEWSSRKGEGGGVLVGRHGGTVPSDVRDLCELPVAGAASHATFSPDGTRMAWQDGEGVKVAGVPSLAAGTAACTLSSPPVLLSATGSEPSFGGA
jgi:hypothetical protein